MKNKKFLLVMILALSISLLTWGQTKPAPAKAATSSNSATVTLYELDNSTTGKKAVLGNATLTQTDRGLEVSVVFSKPVPDGSYGFHIHEGTSLAPAAGTDGKMVVGMGAKGHYDPATTKAHMGPSGNGHLGDLPLLVLKGSKVEGTPLIAPNIKKLDDLYGRVLMIHKGADNYSDSPAANGGGGDRWIAGTIVKK